MTLACTGFEKMYYCTFESNIGSLSMISELSSVDDENNIEKCNIVKNIQNFAFIGIFILNHGELTISECSILGNFAKGKVFNTTEDSQIIVKNSFYDILSCNNERNLIIENSENTSIYNSHKDVHNSNLESYI